MIVDIFPPTLDLCDPDTPPPPTRRRTSLPLLLRSVSGFGYCEGQSYPTGDPCSTPSTSIGSDRNRDAAWLSGSLPLPCPAARASPNQTMCRDCCAEPELVA